MGGDGEPMPRDADPAEGWEPMDIPSGYEEFAEDVTIWDVSVSMASDTDVLRRIAATVSLDVPAEETAIGYLRGLIAWRCSYTDLWAAGDAVSAEAEVLGHAAGRIRRWLHEHDVEIDTAVMIELLWLRPEVRGHGLTGRIVEELLEVLDLDVDSTLIVLQPEPQQETGGPMPMGPERNAALRRLRRAYERSGFSRWQRTPVWWRGPAIGES